MGLSTLSRLACLIAAPALFAASGENFGTAQGCVTDSHGAPLAGVSVTFFLKLTGATRVVLTDANGAFRMPHLPPGPIEVRLTKEGFASIKTQAEIKLGANVFQFRMATESMACVEVVAVSASVDRTTCTVGVSRSSESLSRLPRPSSSTGNQAALLAPGVAGANSSQPGGASIRQASAPANTETYRHLEENPFKAVRQAPLSTFSIDVDTASYSNVRRFLDSGAKPPQDAVRIEEMMNYFTYAYPEPEEGKPFSVATEVFDCPWAPAHRLVRIGLQARRMDLKSLPPRNLVFLIDVSGSMWSENRLPLVKRGLIRLCDTLRPEDHVALVVYAGSSGLVLEPTSGAQKGRIQEALAHLEAGGSTHGSAGIRQAYEVARQHFQKGADNRVLLCTDGDFNVGESDEGSLVRLIEGERASGVFLTCLGFGMGNLRDATLEQLADKGNGNYAYIDSLKEMEKVFGAGGSSLVTVAKDVKLQVEFNPSRAKAYRLIGYENRLLAAEDFNDDTKDAGEMNAGHSVTALYEVVPPETSIDLPPVDRLKYQSEPRSRHSGGTDLLTVKVRFKKSDAFFSRRLEFPVKDEVRPIPEATEDSRWAAAVATFGMVLRDSPAKGSATFGMARTLASGAMTSDAGGLRAEFLRMLGLAEAQGPRTTPGAP